MKGEKDHRECIGFGETKIDGEKDEPGVVFRVPAMTPLNPLASAMSLNFRDLEGSTYLSIIRVAGSCRRNSLGCNPTTPGK